MGKQRNPHFSDGKIMGKSWENLMKLMLSFPHRNSCLMAIHHFRTNHEMCPSGPSFWDVSPSFWVRDRVPVKTWKTPGITDLCNCFVHRTPWKQKVTDQISILLCSETAHLWNPQICPTIRKAVSKWLQKSIMIFPPNMDLSFKQKATRKCDGKTNHIQSFSLKTALFVGSPLFSDTQISHDCLCWLKIPHYHRYCIHDSFYNPNECWLNLPYLDSCIPILTVKP